MPPLPAEAVSVQVLIQQVLPVFDFFSFFSFFFIPVSYLNVEGNVLSGVLNLIYWVSVAAAPAEPWEGRVGAPSFLPPLCHLPSQGWGAVLGACSAPLGPDGPLGWFDAVVLLPVQRHFPLLGAGATHQRDIFER